MASTRSTNGAGRWRDLSTSTAATAALIAVAMLAGCAADGESIDSAPPQTARTVPATAEPRGKAPQVIDVHADYAWIYSGLDELHANSDAIVTGRVTAVEYRVSPEYDPYTVTTVKVIEVFKGDAEAGSTIYVIEPGGEMSRADSIRSSGRALPVKPSDETSKVRVTYDGAPARARGQQVIYFLKAFPADALLPQAYYKPIGPLAEFVVGGGQAERFVPSGWTQSRMRMNVRDLEEQVQGLASPPKP